MSTRSVTAGPLTHSIKPVPSAPGRPTRVSRRTPYRVPCRVRLVDAATGQARSVVGETVNISSRGVALQVAVDAPIGTWVETLVDHPNGDPLLLCGTVVHSRRTLTSSYELGVTILSDTPPAFA